MGRVTELRINGSSRRIDADDRRTLLGVLRDDLDLTGAKYGCGEGRCGACTVLVDDEPARSCLVRVGAVAGKSITTIEGLERDGELHPLQRAFLDAGALQCGYCTPGMIMAGVGLLAKHPRPDDRPDRRGDGRQRLPVRDLSPHPRRDPGRLRGHEHEGG